jgi:hypothetical protein
MYNVLKSMICSTVIIAYLYNKTLYYMMESMRVCNQFRAKYPEHPQQLDSDNTDQCNICLEAYVVRKKKSMWINCSEKKYEFWVHALCVGIVGKKDDIDVINYYYPQHIIKV